jgi:hypothetical protein
VCALAARHAPPLAAKDANSVALVALLLFLHLVGLAADRAQMAMAMATDVLAEALYRLWLYRGRTGMAKRLLALQWLRGVGVQLASVCRDGPLQVNHPSVV